MNKAAFHYSFMLIILLFAFFYFTFLGHAKAQNQKEQIKKQISDSLIQKAKKALLSGNTKQAEIYRKQIKSLGLDQSQPIWLKKDANNDFLYKSRQNKVIDEKEFIRLLYEMPYEKAKIELDKKLLTNPNNTKLRLIYLDLAEKNNDSLEAERHRSLLGIKQEKPTESNFKTWLKYLLVIVIISLIIFEVVSIYKTTQKQSPQIPSNIKSL